MTNNMRKLIEKASPLRFSLAGRWAWAIGLFAVTALLFVPVWNVIGGMIGVVTFTMQMAGGYVLGKRQGMLYGFLSALGFIPLWGYVYNWEEVTSAISGPFLSAGLGWLGGRLHEFVHGIREQSRQLMETRVELMQAEKMALFGEVAAGVAHEINQPLAIMNIVAERAMRTVAKGKTDNLIKDLDTIRDQAKRAGQIVFRLRSTSRNFEEDEKQQTDFNYVIEEAQALFRTQLESLGVECNLALDRELPLVRCHANSIHQLVVYLLLNARDAVADMPLKRIEIHTRAEGQEVVCEVVDTGVGIGPEVAKQIFEPFFTTKDVGVGSGLGLAICYRIVHEHRGRIGVTTAPGQGATFWFRLPIGAAPSQPLSEGPVVESTPGSASENTEQPETAVAS